MREFLKKQTLYSIRWQLSTPILAIVPIFLSRYWSNNFWVDAAIANFIGAFIFYWIDKWIFRKEQDK